MMSTRYELRQGKYGIYFYDTYAEEDLTLDEVISLLNGED